MANTRWAGQCQIWIPHSSYQGGMAQTMPHERSCIAQFFPSLNHQFLSLCLKKAGLNTNVIRFFNSYHSNRFTSYSWNTFTSPSFNVNVGVGQGSALSPILSALYLALIIKMFKKRIKNLNKEIPTDILFFVDDGLLISQEKSYKVFIWASGPS